MSNVLFTTTFNKKLYEVSGKHLLQSFQKHVPWGKMLVGWEDYIDTLPMTPQFIYHDIGQNYFLKSWIDRNSDFIPTKFGGDADWNDEIFTKTKQHQFRRRASLWFRKIVVLSEAYNHARQYNYSIIVSLDSDILFMNKFPETKVPNLINNFDLLYYYGPHRKRMNKGWECGFVSFNLKNKGGIFLEKIFTTFNTNKFREYIRYDDSYIFAKIREENKDLFIGRDLAATTNHSYVMDYGYLLPYIRHNKGKHNSLFP